MAAHDKKLVNEITDAIAQINESQKEINEKMEIMRQKSQIFYTLGRFNNLSAVDIWRHLMCAVFCLKKMEEN